MKRLRFACLLLFALKMEAQTITPHYLLARSKGKLPAIAYGQGADRLGGAKMGYIDTNVVFRIIDSTTDLYNVQLSKYHTAFIEKQFLKIDNSIPVKPFYLTGSFSAKGDTTYDVVSIGMEEKLPYKSWMEINPSRIMVDIYGVQSNTNWITQLRTLKEVKDVYYEQVEDDVVRVTIQLQHKQHWGYSIGYKGKSLQVKVRRQPKSLDIRNLKIAIDAGHGGTNMGASGVTANGLEKDYTLLFAKQLQKYLKSRGVKKIVMTRTIDTTFDNKDRVVFMQQEMPDLLISLHLNSSGNKDVKGVSTYYKHIGFKPLTAAILKQMLTLDLAEFGNVGSFNFMFNAPTDFPNCLVEIAFLSNVQDEKKIMSPKFHADVAKKIYLGINNWLTQLK
ncbi:N-acetylmuramoyl-L-alanine amidase family protein [Sediminibacterium ginsengisoli]|uniref:N-acetylmuramoyl-L-alanine amidase n=1 Tax=Sediminibacterium ginsengisoli TaxID=413434 RepID=A0A1T4LX20_9BACT|nr:N-acetylmuramoyl-L-alanine amidase [Sediminibacterium ginsengisoli]SJZ59176.1 N-acetylmuramoyl-L-alanine amidase [Sediminibacterium ginsengisoli]